MDIAKKLLDLLCL